MIDAPLTEESFARLDDLLLARNEIDDDCLVIDEAHGFITALQVAHSPMAQEEWLALILGDTPFADESAREEMEAYLLSMWDEIEAMLVSGREFEPLIIEEEDEAGETVESYEGWCFGFMAGVSHDQGSWEELPKAAQELLIPIATLALLYSEEEPDVDDDEYGAWIELLPGAVVGLYQYWQD